MPLDGGSESEGIAGPLGLGFRVPCLVISPYTRGGLVASEVFDHTSQLRLLERRFGVPVPNLSDWRRQTVGDLTSAFDFAAPRSEPARLPNPILAGSGPDRGQHRHHPRNVGPRPPLPGPTERHARPIRHSAPPRPQWAATRLRWTG